MFTIGMFARIAMAVVGVGATIETIENVNYVNKGLSKKETPLMDILNTVLTVTSLIVLCLGAKNS